MDKFVITEEEKKRILTMHILRSKNQYLNEDISSKVKPSKSRYFLTPKTGTLLGNDIIGGDFEFEKCQYVNMCNAKSGGSFDNDAQQIFFDCTPKNRSNETAGGGRFQESTKIVSNLHLVKWEESGSRVNTGTKGVYTPVENAELVKELKDKFC